MQNQAQRDSISIGALHITPQSRAATLGGNPIPLTSAEFDLLEFMALHAGEILSRDQLCEELRGIPYNGFDRSIDLRVSQLRKKMNDNGRNPRRIKSVRGVGYLFSINQ